MKCATYYLGITSHLRTTSPFDWNTPVCKRKISLVNTNKEIAIIRLKNISTFLIVGKFRELQQ
jgi:hypothetical protein